LDPVTFDFVNRDVRNIVASLVPFDRLERAIARRQIS
jgi:hypothetical protein